MQGGRSASAVEAAKEAAANVGASAWAGKEKTKAVVEATKRDAMRSNAAAKERATAATYHPSAAAAAAPPARVGRALDDRPAAPTDGSVDAPGGAAGVVGHGAPDRPVEAAATTGAGSGVAPGGGAVEGQAGNVPVATTEGAGGAAAGPTAVTQGSPPAAASDGYPPAGA